MLAERAIRILRKHQEKVVARDKELPKEAQERSGELSRAITIAIHSLEQDAKRSEAIAE